MMMGLDSLSSTFDQDYFQKNQIRALHDIQRNIWLDPVVFII